MFEQLRVRFAIKQSFSLGVMLVIVLALIFSYNISKLSNDIDNKLNAMVGASYFNFINGSIDEDGIRKDVGRDTLAIFIDNDNTVYLNDIAFYNAATVKAIIDKVIENGSDGGNLRIDGNYAAYAYRTNALGQFIYIYDYTLDFENMRSMLIIMCIAGSLGMIAITIFSFSSARKSVAPIERAFVKQQELVANASHELKTPLTIINTDISILNSSRESMTEEQQKWLDSINGQISRMSNLVTEMLELAKMESGKDNEIKVPVNLSDVTESVVLGAEVLAFEHNITLESDIRESVMINGVEAQIEKLIYILVENALKYTDEGGKVTVSVSGDRKKAVLKVKNTGAGIARENLPKLFDRFYRTDEAHTASNSFGLGLSIAKSIVDSHGGTIGVDSKEGEFTEFVVLFRQTN